MKIAVTGPTGNIGKKLTELLLNDGSHEVVLLARSPEKLATEAGRGATVIEGSLHDENYVIEATKGADALFWLNPPDHTVDDIREFYRSLANIAVSAAKANGIKHVVLLSSIGAHIEGGTGPISGSTESEKIMKKEITGLTILRPAFFMENFMMSIETINQADSIFLPVSGKSSLPMIATSDIAQAAYKAVTSAAPSNTKIIPLHGPKDYSFDEVTDIIGSKLGKKITFVKSSADQTHQAMTGMGASSHFADIIIEMYGSIETGHIKAEFERNSESTTPTTFDDFADKFMIPALKSN